MEGKEQRLDGVGTATLRADREDGRAAGFLKKLLIGMMYGLWGYLLGGATLPFGATPFGIALLAAADHRALYVFGGLCLGALSGKDGLFLLAVYIDLLALRLLCRFVLDLPSRLRRRGRETTLGDVTPYLFREHVSLRMASACVAAFAVGLRKLMAGGFLYYDLYGLLLSVLAAPVAVLLMSGFFGGRRRPRWQTRVGFLTLGSLLCFAAADLRLYGIALGAFGAMIATLHVSRREGIVAGMVTGTLFGVAIAPSLAPLFAFGALAAGLLLPVSLTLGALASFAVSTAWGYYVLGLGILNGLFSALLAAHLLFGVWDKLFFAEKKNKSAEAVAEEPTASVAAVAEPVGQKEFLRLTDTAERIHALCGGFAELGERFDAMARNMQRPDRETLRGICDRAFDGSCTSCASKEECWGGNYQQTAAEVDRLCAALYGKGKARREELPVLGARCARLPDILEEINHNAARYEAELLASDRTELLASDFRVMSRLLASVMAEEDREYETDPSAAARLSEALGEGISVCVLGKRRKKIALWGKRVTLPAEREALRKKAEEVLGIPLREESAEEERELLVLSEEAPLTVRYAIRQKSAPDEKEYCGDTANAFFGQGGRFYGLISDGMGAGEEAALTSGCSGIFLERLLRAGGSCEEILELLNSFLRNRGSGSLRECSATVDLMELDLMEGRATFYKSGAAPTYVLRDGGLFKIRARTVPMGIIRDPDVQKIGFSMGVGDLAVMVSDGVTQGREECPWLFDLIHSHAETSDPERMADLIMKYAIDEGSPDDISVMVIQIKE